MVSQGLVTFRKAVSLGSPPGVRRITRSVTVTFSPPGAAWGQRSTVSIAAGVS